MHAVAGETFDCAGAGHRADSMFMHRQNASETAPSPSIDY